MQVQHSQVSFAGVGRHAVPRLGPRSSAVHLRCSRAAHLTSPSAQLGPLSSPKTALALRPVQTRYSEGRDPYGNRGPTPEEGYTRFRRPTRGRQPEPTDYAEPLQPGRQADLPGGWGDLGVRTERGGDLARSEAGTAESEWGRSTGRAPGTPGSSGGGGDQSRLSWNPVEVVKREQGLQSNRLPTDLRESVENAVEQLGFRVTPGDVAARAGVKLAQAEEALKALAYDTAAALEVSSAGDVVYAFPSGFRNTLRSRSLLLSAAPLLAQARKAIAYLTRVLFGTALVSSIAIVWLAVVAILTGTSRDRDDRRGGGMRGGPGYYNEYYGPYGGGGGPSARLYFNLTDLLIYLDPNYGQVAQQRLERGAQLTFVEAIFSFVFGDGDPNAKFDEQRWTALATLIQQRGGVVTAEEMAPFLDPPAVDPQALASGSAAYSDESFVLPALIRFGGEPFVDEGSGALLYRFPALQTTSVTREYLGAAPATSTAPVEETPWELTAASPGQPGAGAKDSPAMASICMTPHHTTPHHTTPHHTTPHHTTPHHTTPHHTTPHHATPRHATPRHATPRHATPRHATPRHATPRHATPRHATPRHATPRHATPRHATPRHATPRHATPRHATPRHATPRHATPRHATPRHATPRHATPHHTTPHHTTPHHTASECRHWPGMHNSNGQQRRVITAVATVAGTVALGVLNLVGVATLASLLGDPGARYVLAAQGLGWVAGLLPALGAYAVSFFAIPSFRWFWNQRRNADIQARNKARAAASRLVARGGRWLQEKLGMARQAGERRTVRRSDIVFSSDKDTGAQSVTGQELDSWDQRMKGRGSPGSEGGRGSRR
ncbi:hypothetical protein QJQ45_019060 [Haematococcus lacustris]|nr:hypothetical protein QJQ45_019060 [Haematococcus lacustris]